jgi:hypothetical protein
MTAVGILAVIARSTGDEGGHCHSGAMQSIEPRILRFPDAQLRI